MLLAGCLPMSLVVLPKSSRQFKVKKLFTLYYGGHTFLQSKTSFESQVQVRLSNETCTVLLWYLTPALTVQCQLLIRNELEKWFAHLLDNLSVTFVDLKNSGDFNLIQTHVLWNASTVLHKLGYVATQWRAGQFVKLISSHERNGELKKWTSLERLKVK